jgi:hypothetical protein
MTMRHVERRLDSVEWHSCGRCGGCYQCEGMYVLHGCGMGPVPVPERLEVARLLSRIEADLVAVRFMAVHAEEYGRARRARRRRMVSP